MKRKHIILFLMIFSLIFLVGWGKKNVELLNDKKLIDLDLAIEKCIPGAESPKRDDVADSDTECDEQDEEDSDTVKIPSDDTEDNEDKTKTLDINVRNRTVTYERVEYTDMNKLKEKIRQDNEERVTFKLVDDFAEAHVYNEVIAILSELESEIGLNYSID